MHDRNRPRSHAQALELGLTTKIHIVEMKRETRIEPKLVRAERLRAYGQHDAVEQLARLCRRPVNGDIRAPKPGTMPNRATEIVRCLAREFLVAENPRWLPREAPPIAGDSDEV